MNTGRERVPRRHRHRRGTLWSRVGFAAMLLVLVTSLLIVSPGMLGWLTPGGTGASESPAPGQDEGGASAARQGRPPSPTATTSPRTSAPPTTAATTPPNATTAPPPPISTGFAAYESQVLAITNTERAKEDCPALRMDPALRTAARRHSAEMARYRHMTHTGRNGSDPDDRMKAAGYDVSGGWAENVAVGYRTPTAVMKGWMGSSGHRRNILTCAFRAVGIGVARGGDGRLYWTQDFGAR